MISVLAARIDIGASWIRSNGEQPLEHKLALCCAIRNRIGESTIKFHFIVCWQDVSRLINELAASMLVPSEIVYCTPSPSFEGDTCSRSWAILFRDISKVGWGINHSDKTCYCYVLHVLKKASRGNLQCKYKSVHRGLEQSQENRNIFRITFALLGKFRRRKTWGNMWYKIEQWYLYRNFNNSECRC